MSKPTDCIIKTSELEFSFTKATSFIRNVNLEVQRSSIYGFLGANGAGKTTIIRLLLGLLPDHGKSVYLFGEHLRNNRISILSKVGALIEQPSLYEHISGYDNLDIIRRLKKVSPKKIHEVLERVRLTGAAHKTVRTYSLGMKQRLGIAIALVGDPELLVLDEPMNGLDPNGMAEVRDLLRHLNKESGVTIFLSSHLLSEVEKIATHVGIISEGKMVFQGSLEKITMANRDLEQFYLTVTASN